MKYLQDKLRALAKDDAAYEELLTLLPEASRYPWPLEAAALEALMYVQGAYVRRINSSACGLLGLSCETAEGKHLTDVFAPEVAHSLILAQDKVVAGHGETVVTHLTVNGRQLSFRFESDSWQRRGGALVRMSPYVQTDVGTRELDPFSWITRAPLPTLVLDPMNKLLAIIAAAEDFLGISAELATDDSPFFLQTFDLSTMRPSPDVLGRLLRRDGHYVQDIHVQRLDGKWLHMRSRGYYLSNQDGTHGGLLVQMEPLPDHDHADTITALLNQLLPAFAEPTSWKDISGNYLGCNDKFLKTLGYASAEEILGLKEQEVFKAVPQYLDRIRAQDDLVLQERKPQYFVIENYTGPDGQPTSYGILKVPIEDASGNMVILSLGRNLSAIQRMERHGNKFRQFIDALPFSITLMDMGERFLLANRHALQALGKTEDEVIGKHYAQVTPQAINHQLEPYHEDRRTHDYTGLQEMVFFDGQQEQHLLTGTHLISGFEGHDHVVLGYTLNITELQTRPGIPTDSLSLLRGVIDSSPNLIYLRQPDGKFLLVNQAALALMDAPQAQVLSAQYKLPERLEAFMRLESAVLEGGQTVVQEEGVSDATGALRWYQTRKYLLVLPGGQQVQLAISMDVTDRMRAEGELLRKTAELQAIFMALPDLYLRVDKTGVIRDFHAAPKSEFVPYRRVLLFRALAEVLPEATAEMLNAIKGHVLRAQRSARVDFQLRGQHYECRLIPFFGNEVVAVLRNISLPKRQDLLLRQSEERYRSVIDNVRELFFQTDAHGQFVFLSASWAEALGYSAQSLQGIALVQCLHSADRPLVEKLVQHLLAQKKGSFRAEVRVPTADGTLRWMDLQASCTRLPGSDTYGLTGNLHDVTERKQAEQALVASKEEAERATRAKSEFLATVSHELRTPLNGIIGITELMRQTLLSADQEDLMETLRISSETLLQLINDLLDFSKIESGQLVLEDKPFAVHKLLQDCLELLRPKASQHRVQLALYLDPRVPLQLEGDALRLRQVVFNLVDNAIKFSREGHVRISLYPLPTAAGAPPQLCLAVADDGIGIEAAKQAIIFEPFVQAEAQTTRKFGGTGLGLAICQRIATHMGGRLWVHSTPQHGSTFFLSFPSSAPLQPLPPTVPHRLLLWAVPSLPMGALKDYLEQMGHAVLTCQDAAQAQPLLQQWQPHYVVVGYSALAQAVQLSLPPPQQVLLWRDHSAGPQPSEKEALSAHPPLPWQLSGVWIARFLQDPASGWQSPYASLRAPVPHTTQTLGHVLVAEDNAINQKLVGRMLQHLGYTYTLAGDGHAVLDALAHRHYDLVLMDIQMPGMDGMETTRHLRQHLQLAIPIVAMTAHVLPGFEAACRAAGMTAYLPKPIRLEGLSAMLAKLLPQAFPRV